MDLIKVVSGLALGKYKYENGKFVKIANKKYKK